MHQYVESETGRILSERLFGDAIVRFLYSRLREKNPYLFRQVTSAWMSGLLALWQFDMPLAARISGNRRFLAQSGIDLDECLAPAAFFTTPRRIFERKIRYWHCRPMPEEPEAVVAPADARMLVGSLNSSSLLFLKDKFFDLRELLGAEKITWRRRFDGGEYAVFRLTPDKYHFNHLPVSGRVVDFYAIQGEYHSCNPSAVVEMVTPYSKNKRVVTVIDTDVVGGSRVGLVAMIEVVALMIGEVVQCYSQERYDNPRSLVPGMFVLRGQPKSMYRPGSSTDVLLFEKERVCFRRDLLEKMRQADVHSRFTLGFGAPLAEIDVRVRSRIAGKK